MSLSRTIPATLAAVIAATRPEDEAKDLIKRTDEASRFIHLHRRLTSHKASGAAGVPFTADEVAFLRDRLADFNPVAVLVEVEAILRASASHARTIMLPIAGPTADLPKLGRDAKCADGLTPLRVRIAKDTPADKREALKLDRADATMGQKALDGLDLIRSLRDSWTCSCAVQLAIRGADPEAKPKRVGKRLESHLAAVLASDPLKLAAALKAQGFPDEVAGMILAKATKLAAAMVDPSPIPAALPAPVVPDAEPHPRLALIDKAEARGILSPEAAAMERALLAGK
jgi:hypothetical protein